MYERFTDRARKVMQLANQEAQRFKYEYVGAVHILLGLVEEGSGVAANVLKNLDVDPRKIRLEVEKLVQSGPDMATMGKLPQTPRAKRVIEYSMEEARNLNHNHVGTEHILLGLLREPAGGWGVAFEVLMNLGLKLEEVREDIQNLLGTGEVVRPEAKEQAQTRRLMIEVEVPVDLSETMLIEEVRRLVSLLAHTHSGMKKLSDLKIVNVYTEAKKDA
jgi:ATP-dependent Clp protease ATP-binding subunit ClpA